MTETRMAILTYAASREMFRFADLLSYLNGLFAISKVTLSWYLKGLVKDNRIFKLGRGIYTSRRVEVREYEPELSVKLLRLSKKLSKAFPYTEMGVFDGRILSDFQHHHSTNNLLYIEVERESQESVFHYLKQAGYTAYLSPDKDFFYNHVDMSRSAIIVKPLITESPLIETQGVKTPKLEKILVDILCDDDMDYLHENEWSRIFENANAKYSISRTTIMRYASRRNAKEKVEQALENVGKNYD